MIHANINQRDAQRHFQGEPMLIRAIDWLRAMPPEQPDGIVKLEGDAMYVNVHRYETLPRESCRFESHRRYVDLQYCISGGELIDYCRLDELRQNGPYEAERDFYFHHPVERFSTLRMTPGDFAVFYPVDGHRPKVADTVCPAVRKLVIKIDVNLLQKNP